jgi:rhodanese-related sulfurtransferase
MPRNKRKITPRRMPKSRSAKKTTPVWEWILIGIMVVAAVVLLYNRFAPQPAELTVTVSQASEKRDQGAFMLDVREPSEWQDFHMPGATLIPLGELPDRLSEIPTDQEIVVVCNSGNRSRTGRDILLDAGFSNVTSMTGGMQEWRSDGLPVVSGP